MRAADLRSVYDLSTWTGRVTLTLLLLVAAAGTYIVWDAGRPPPVAATLAGRNVEDRARLMRWVMRDDGTLDEVIAALHDDDSEVRSGAVTFLWLVAMRGRSARDIASLIRGKGLDAGEDEEVQLTALEAGIWLRAFRAPDDLAKLRAVPAGRRTYWADRALGTLGDGGLASLLEILENDDAWLRENAAVALGGMGGEAKPAVAALERHLADTNRRVRIQATAAVERIDPHFDLHGRGSHLGDAGAEEGELDVQEALRDMNLDPAGNPLPAPSAPR